MVFRFKLVSDEVTNFCREIEISPDATFLQLREAILDSVGFAKDDIDSFFICDEDWQKETEITLEDMGSSSDRDSYLMGDTALGDMLEDEGQRLIFVFDYLTERSFFMELKEIITGREADMPLCTREVGNPPRQKVDIDDFEKSIDAKAASAVAAADMDFDMDNYGDAGFNDDELGGFDNISFEDL